MHVLMECGGDCAVHLFFVQCYTPQNAAAKLAQLSAEAESSAEVSLPY